MVWELSVFQYWKIVPNQNEKFRRPKQTQTASGLKEII